MCKCTPNIRTPFCGRPGCEWPEQQLKPIRKRRRPQDADEDAWVEFEKVLDDLGIGATASEWGTAWVFFEAGANFEWEKDK